MQRRDFLAAFAVGTGIIFTGVPSIARQAESNRLGDLYQLQRCRVLLLPCGVWMRNPDVSVEQDRVVMRFD